MDVGFVDLMEKKMAVKGVEFGVFGSLLHQIVFFDSVVVTWEY